MEEVRKCRSSVLNSGTTDRRLALDNSLLSPEQVDVLCTAGYCATSLGSTHEILVPYSATPTTSPDNQQGLQTLPDVPMEAKSSLDENERSRPEHSARHIESAQ